MRHRRHLNGSSNAAAPVAAAPPPTGWGSGRVVPLKASSPPKQFPARLDVARRELSAAMQLRVAPARPVATKERTSGAATARRPQPAQPADGRDAAIASRTTRRVQSARGDGEGRHRPERRHHEAARAFCQDPAAAQRAKGAVESLPRLPPAPSTQFPQVPGARSVRVPPPLPRKAASRTAATATGTDPASHVQWAVKVIAPSSGAAASGPDVAASPPRVEPPEVVEVRRVLRDRYDGTRSIRQAFLTWDSDKDGRIRPHELHDMLGRLGLARALGHDKMQTILQHVFELPESSLGYEEFCRFICRPDSAAETAGSSAAEGHADNNRSRQRPRRATHLVDDADACAEIADAEQVVALLRKKYESRKLRQVFRDWDLDKDGGVTLSELESNLRRQGLRLPNPQLQELFDAHDLDHDGRLLYHEFANLVLGPIEDRRHSAVRARQRRQQTQEQQQQQSDSGGTEADKDSYLSLRSSWAAQPSPRHASDPGFRATVQRKLRAFAPRLNDAYAAFDNDHSGNLSYGEFRQGLQELGMHFTEREFLHLATSVDTDGSGEISFKEFCQVFRDDGAATRGQRCVSNDDSKPHANHQRQEVDGAERTWDLDSSRRRRTAGTFDFSHLARRTKIPTRHGRTPVHNTKGLISGIQKDVANSTRFATEAQVYGNGYCPRGSSATATATTTLGQDEKLRRDAGNSFRLQRLREQLEQHNAKTSGLHSAYDEAQDRRTQTLHRHQTRYHQRIEEQQPRHPLAPGGKSMRATRPSSAATAAPFL